MIYSNSSHPTPYSSAWTTLSTSRRRVLWQATSTCQHSYDVYAGCFTISCGNLVSNMKNKARHDRLCWEPPKPSLRPLIQAETLKSRCKDIKKKQQCNKYPYSFLQSHPRVHLHLCSLYRDPAEPSPHPNTLCILYFEGGVGLSV